MNKRIVIRGPEPVAARKGVAAAGSARDGGKVASEISQRKSKRRWDERRRLTEAESVALLDYLHGDVDPSEVKLAASWEYSREDKTTIALAAEYKAEAAKDEEDRSCRFTSDVPALWQLPSFPGCHWRDIPTVEKDLMRRPVIDAIGVDDLRVVNALGILRDWKRKADDPHKRGKLPARAGGYGSFEHVIFAIDFSESPKSVQATFAKWLRNQADLFSRHSKPSRRGKTRGANRYFAALHDLAVWRLDRLCGFDAAARWTEENRRFDSYRRGRKYRGHEKIFGPVYDDEKEWDRARRRAQKLMRTWFPSDETETFAERVVSHVGSSVFR